MNKKKENDKLNRWSEPLKEKYFCFAKDFVKLCYIMNTEYSNPSVYAVVVAAQKPRKSKFMSKKFLLS